MKWNVQSNLKRISDRRVTAQTIAAIAGLGIAGVLLTGCASISAQTHPDLGVPQLAPTKPQSVQLLTAAPKDPYVRLGEVILSVDGNPPREKLEQRLKAGAANLGADGIFISSDQTHIFPIEYLGYWGNTRDEDWRRLIVGVAYKTK